MRALTELKKECMSRLKPQCSPKICFVCFEPRPKRLTIHHHCYDQQSITYNQFENSDDGRLKYYAHLIDEIKNNPYNFTVLCIDCHNNLEYFLHKYFKEKTTELISNFRLELIYNATISSRQEKEKPPKTGLDDFFWN